MACCGGEGGQRATNNDEGWCEKEDPGPLLHPRALTRGFLVIFLKSAQLGRVQGRPLPSIGHGGQASISPSEGRSLGKSLSLGAKPSTFVEGFMEWPRRGGLVG